MKFRWLRRLVRRNTRPIPEDKAVDWKKRLSFLYAFFAWNSFGFVCYMVMTGRGDWAKYYGYKTEEEEMSSAARISSYYHVGVPRVYRIHGFSSIENRGTLEEEKVE